MTELFCSVCQTLLVDKVHIVADMVVYPTENGFSKAQVVAVYMRCDEHKDSINVSYLDENPNLPDKPFFPNREKVYKWMAEREQKKALP